MAEQNDRYNVNSERNCFNFCSINFLVNILYSFLQHYNMPEYFHFLKYFSSLLNRA